MAKDDIETLEKHGLKRAAFQVGLATTITAKATTTTTTTTTTFSPLTTIPYYYPKNMIG